MTAVGTDLWLYIEAAGVMPGHLLLNERMNEIAYFNVRWKNEKTTFTLPHRTKEVKRMSRVDK